jgi:ribosomal RNA assembly protein
MIATLMMPEERKRVLIGKKGAVKKLIEEKTRTRIEIGFEVNIEGESLDALRAKEIVRAIGRGFSPRKAMLLLDEECQLKVISMSGENPSTIKRLFARVIGRDGKTRRKIEQCSGAAVSVYGKTVSVIGKADCIDIAARAVEQILGGRSHGYVYKRMEHSKQKAKRKYI